MIQRTLLACCLMILGSVPSFANSDSSRVADLLKIVSENRMDSALAYANLSKAHDIAVSSKNRRLLGDVYLSSGIMHYIETEFDSCEFYWKKASQIFADTKDTLNWGKAERLVGVAFDLQGRLDSSLVHLQLAMMLNKSINYKKGIGEVYTSLGIIQQKLDRFEAAADTYREALQLAMDEGNEKALGPIYNNLGSLYQNMGELDSGMKYLKLALSMQDQVENQLGMAKILHNIGTIELEKKKYKSAKDYYFSSIALTGGASSYESLQGIVSIGNCYLQLGEYDSARTILLLARQVNEIKQAGRSYKSIYNYLWQVEEKQGNYEKA